MLSTILFNLLASFVAVSVSGTVVLHDTRLDKAFVSTVAPASDTTVREFGHSVMSDQHIHSSSHAALSNAGTGDPLLTNRSHKKHINVPYARLRLASLTA